MRKNINKLATLVMTGALAASMSFGALAATQHNANINAGSNLEVVGSGNTMSIIKKIKTDGKTFAPNGYFSFTVSPVTTIAEADKEKAFAYDKNDSTKTKTFEIKPGVADGVTVLTNAEFTPDNDLAAEYSATFNVQANIDKFDNAGVYMYTLNENYGYNGKENATANDNYPGMVYDSTTYTMYVFITNIINDAGTVTGRQVSNVVLMNANGEKVNALVNVYGDETTSNDDKVYDLTISKEVTGNMGSHGDTFNILLSVASDVTGGESFKVTKYVEGAAQTDVITLDSTASEALSLPISEKITYQIDGLTSGDVVSVKEKEAGLDSYETKVTLSAGVAEADANNKIGDTLESTETLKVKVSANDSTLKITNKRDAVTPTGVAMDVAPYALMVALAGGAAATFLRKKESFED